jgi:nicotinate dehydrogenase subunit B
VARAIGFEPENVRILTPYVGGGFGGKAGGNQAVEAAQLSRRWWAGPCRWRIPGPRSSSTIAFQPASRVKIASGMDDNGKGGRSGTTRSTRPVPERPRCFMTFPNKRVAVYGEWGRPPAGMHPFAVGAWRAPGANTNRFAGAQQIDIMAAAAGMDPMEFRLMNTKDDRMLSGCCGLCGMRREWESRPGPAPGGNLKGRGVACGIDAETYVGLVAEVTVDAATGEVAVDRVVCAPGHGRGGESRWSAHADGGLRRNGAGLRVQRGAPLRRGEDSGHEFRHLPVGPVQPDARDRNRVRVQR